MHTALKLIAPLLVVLGGAATLLVSPVIAWVLIAAGALLFAVEACFLAMANGWLPQPKINMSKATLRAYEKTEDTFLAEAARRLGDEKVQSYYANAILQDRDVPIFGKRPPSMKRREIPLDEIEKCFFDAEAKTLTRHLENKPRYTDLAIRWSDYRRKLPELKTWGSK